MTRLISDYSTLQNQYYLSKKQGGSLINAENKLFHHKVWCTYYR